ncbi:MAG: hypothetical protein JWP66_1084 [Naasia sp.]|nr:hypothetical protein [Naasia sp.]
MKRVTIRYGDRDYSIADRSLEAVQREIAEAVESGRAGWIEVNYGEGRPTPAHLLITAGTPLMIHYETSGHTGDDPEL